MRLAAALLALATTATTARLSHADPAPVPTATATTGTAATDTASPHRFALAVNEPLGWIDAGAFGVSGYGAIDRHQVIRLNVASWSHARTVSVNEGLAYLLAGADGGAGGYGRYTTASASWMYFPRRAYDGPSVELGAIVRLRETLDYYDDLSSDNTRVSSTTIAGSTMVGWSWLGWDRVFASLQLGASFGREAGTEIVHVDGKMDVPSSIAHFDVEGEAFMRFGVLLN